MNWEFAVPRSCQVGIATCGDDEVLEDVRHRDWGLDVREVADARLTRGGMLVERDGAESRHGFDLLAMVRQAALRQRFNISALWVHDIQIANEMLRSGDTDHAIEPSRAVIDDLLDAGNMIWGGVATTRWWNRCCDAEPTVTSRTRKPQSSG